MLDNCNSFAINRSKVLAVEGKDDANFFVALLTHLNIDSIQIIPMGGKQPIHDKIAAIKAMRGFSSTVTSLGIAIDADNDYRSAFQAVSNCLRRLDFSVPTGPLHCAGTNPKVTVMLLPSSNNNGMLEDLCLRSVQTDSVMPCLDAFFQCAVHSATTPPQNISKAKVHAFLATRTIPDKRLGEAALASYWPFTSSVFDEVKQFISLL
jgi:hypothetical protein